MEIKSKVTKSGYKQLMIIVALTLITSILPEVIFREWIGSVPLSLPLVKLIILVIAGILSQYLKYTKISKYIIVLGVIILTEIQTKLIISSSIWQETFDMNSFVGNFGGSTREIDIVIHKMEN